MKKYFLLITILFVFFQKTISQDYLPLNIGNIWVYQFQFISFGGGGYGYDRYKITNTTQINGKTYYVLQHIHLQISGNYSCSPILYAGDFPIRVDSINGNVYRAVNCSSFPEQLVDSLKSKKGDITRFCGDTVLCYDTLYYNIFGVKRNSKNFTRSWFEGSNNQRYVKNIGVAYLGYGFMGGSCNSYLRGCVINGAVYGDTSLTGINKISSEVPEKFVLFQNYPNPFNPISKIKFQIAKLSEAKLIVYDALGRVIQTLVNEELSPGTYEVSFDGTNLPSGVYYYTLTSGDFIQTKRMVLIK